MLAAKSHSQETLGVCKSVYSKLQHQVLRNRCYVSVLPLPAHRITAVVPEAARSIHELAQIAELVSAVKFFSEWRYIKSALAGVCRGRTKL